MPPRAGREQCRKIPMAERGGAMPGSPSVGGVSGLVSLIPRVTEDGGIEGQRRRAARASRRSDLGPGW